MLEPYNTRSSDVTKTQSQYDGSQKQLVTWQADAWLHCEAMNGACHVNYNIEIFFSMIIVSDMF